MGAILAIAGVAVREALGNALAVVLVVLSGLLIVLSRYFNLFSLGEEVVVFCEVGLAAIRMCSLALVIFLGCGGVAGDLEQHRLLSVLSKPVSRHAYLIGRFLGVMVVVSIVAVLLGALIIAFLFVDGRGDLTANVLGGVYLEVLQAGLLLSVALVVAPHVTFVPAATAVFFVFVAGHLTEYFLERSLEAGALVHGCVRGLHALVPNLEGLSVVSSIGSRRAPPFPYFALTSLYSAAYISSCLALASLAFRRREVT